MDENVVGLAGSAMAAPEIAEAATAAIAASLDMTIYFSDLLDAVQGPAPKTGIVHRVADGRSGRQGAEP
jgi:hypothetical protein